MGRKLGGGCAPLGEGELSPHLTQCGQGQVLPPSLTCVPSFILIRPTVWPQCTNITHRQTDNGLIAQGEPFYKRSPQKWMLELNAVHAKLLSVLKILSIDFDVCVCFTRLSISHVNIIQRSQPSSAQLWLPAYKLVSSSWLQHLMLLLARLVRVMNSCTDIIVFPSLFLWF